MNKAFVRELEEDRDRCPSCRSAGIAVFEVTLKEWLTEEQRGRLSNPALFCPHESCQIVYFDGFERTVAADEIAMPFWPRDPGTPICPCFGLTVEDIEEEIRKKSLARIRETIRRAQSDEARCITAAPSGHSCVAAVQRCYMNLRRSR